MTYPYTVKSTQELPGGVLLLALELGHEARKFKHEAGQYVTIGFRRRGRKTPVRSFSIVSEPGAGELQVAMRTRGNFTSAAHEVQPGDEVYVQGPFGDFVLNPTYDKNVVFMAGGIGITPFISLLRHVVRAKLPVRITLLYSCRSLAEAPFYDELLRLERQNPGLKVVFFVTGSERHDAPRATVVRSAIDGEHLQKLTGGKFGGITYFVCGPRGFARAMENTLAQNGVRSDRIVTESFAQSSKLLGGRGWTSQNITYALSGGLVVASAVGIMLVDLIRTVPKLSAQGSQSGAATSSQSSSGATTPAANSAESAGDSDSTSSGSSSSQTQTTTPTTTDTTTPTQNYSYSQPVSGQS